MLRIINLSDMCVRADSTLVCVDNTVICVDNVAGGTSNNHIIKVPYRFFENNIDFFITDEFKQNVTFLNLDVTEENGYMILDFEYEFCNNCGYEGKVLSTDGKLIWRGKIYSTDQEDLQNFNIDSSNINITI